MQRAIFIALLFAAALVAQAPSAARDLEAQFQRATMALQSGDLAKAEQGFLAVLRSDPKSVPALGNLGVVYGRMNRPADAVKIYQRALRLMPGQPGILLNLGLAYLKLDAHAEAKPLFAELVRLQPQSRQGRELLATTQMYTGELPTAIATLEALSQENVAPSANAGVLYFLALGYLKQNRPDRANTVFSTLMAALPAARARFLEGKARLETQGFAEAEAALQKAASLDPNLPGLQLELGKTYVSLRNEAQAEAHLRSALSQDPADYEAMYFLGAQWVQSQRYAEGVPLLEKVKQARPALWGTSYYLGKAKLGLKRPAEAVKLLQEAKLGAPDDRSVQYQLARALQAAGRPAEAKKLFTALGNREPPARTISLQ